MIVRFRSSIIALKAVQDIGQDSSANSTMVRRATRSLNRMIVSLVDQLEDADSDQWKEKPQKPIDTAKLNTIQTLANTLEILLTIVASKSTAKIPETYQEAVAKCLPQLKACMGEMGKRKTEVEKENTDKTAFMNYESSFDKFVESISQLEAGVANVSMLQLTNLLINISNTSSDLISSLSHLTDVVIEIPDIEASEMLPNKFEMPKVPTDLQDPIADQAHKLAAYVGEYSGEEKSFVALAEQKKNKETAQSMLKLNDMMAKTVEQILRVS